MLKLRTTVWVNDVTYGTLELNFNQLVINYIIIHLPFLEEINDMWQIKKKLVGKFWQFNYWFHNTNITCKWSDVIPAKRSHLADSKLSVNPVQHTYSILDAVKWQLIFAFQQIQINFMCNHFENQDFFHNCLTMTDLIPHT